jgi:hypothetical protein
MGRERPPRRDPLATTVAAPFAGRVEPLARPRPTARSKTQAPARHRGLTFPARHGPRTLRRASAPGRSRAQMREDAPARRRLSDEPEDALGATVGGNTLFRRSSAWKRRSGWTQGYSYVDLLLVCSHPPVENSVAVSLNRAWVRPLEPESHC